MQDFSEKSISPLGSPVIVTVFCDFLVNGSVNLLPSPVIIGKFPAAHATKAAIGWCRSGTRSVVGRGKPKVRFKSKQIAGAGSEERKKIGQCSRCVVWPRRVDPVLIPPELCWRANRYLFPPGFWWKNGENWIILDRDMMPCEHRKCINRRNKPDTQLQKDSGKVGRCLFSVVVVSYLVPRVNTIVQCLPCVSTVSQSVSVMTTFVSACAFFSLRLFLLHSSSIQ